MGARRKLQFSPRKDELWEERCERCGRCCYEKVWDEDGVWVTDVPCRYLDLKTRLCTVYPRRFEVEPECLSVDREAIEEGIMPDGCAYVRDIPGYRGPKPLPPERS